MEELFRSWAAVLALIVEAIAAILIAAGVLESFVVLLTAPPEGRRRAVWRRFGGWLLLSIEFELGADIVRTAISPTWTQIGQLASIALIRTFLNYFLERDLEKYSLESERSQVPPTDKAA